MTAEAASGAAQPTTNGARHPRLLVADDDLVVQSMLAGRLSRDFDIVGFALDADQAIALAERHLPDVALIDVEMPGGGGLRATREMHARTPGVAIVALSADESDSVVRAMLQAGAMAYVRKGTAAHELVAILRSSISAHAAFASA
jgi:DNA-binding NarL/FixJ family response regulator